MLQAKRADPPLSLDMIVSIRVAKGEPPPTLLSMETALMPTTMAPVFTMKAPNVCAKDEV